MAEESFGRGGFPVSLGLAIVSYRSDRRRQVAVFINFENLIGRVHKSPGGAAPVPTVALGQMCCHYGNAAIRTAYADWSRSFAHQDKLADNGIELVHIPPDPSAGRNGADICLSGDAVKPVFVHPKAELFVLFTGDSDYSALLGGCVSTTIGWGWAPRLTPASAWWRCARGTSTGALWPPRSIRPLGQSVTRAPQKLLLCAFNDISTHTPPPKSSRTGRWSLMRPWMSATTGVATSALSWLSSPSTCASMAARGVTSG
ncbi:NYN domain-containing protein [Nocardiopsis terrae]